MFLFVSVALINCKSKIMENINLKEKTKDKALNRNSKRHTEYGQIVLITVITKADLSLSVYEQNYFLQNKFEANNLRSINLSAVLWERHFPVVQQVKSTLSFGLSVEIGSSKTDNCFPTLNETFTKIIDTLAVTLLKINLKMKKDYSKWSASKLAIGDDEEKLYHCHSRSTQNLTAKNEDEKPRRKEEFYWGHFRPNVESMCAYPVLIDTRQHIKEVFNLKPKVYNNETNRLRTYVNYPADAEQYGTILAANGFVYTGNGIGDQTTCFYCMKSHENWRYTDDIESIHIGMSPTCLMALCLKCGNVPISTLKKQNPFSMPRRLFSIPTNNEHPPTESRRNVRLNRISPIREIGENFARFHEASSSAHETDQAGGLQVSDHFAEENISHLQADNLSRTLQLQCKVCGSNEVQVLFQPCRHIVTCEECSRVQETCIKCGKDIKEKTRIIFYK
uniref:RING-type domain-containing protein n=2 Tax=Biomphalaria glabrata TaxID=6526 RepID=A0A182YU48_BIOGL